MIPSFLAHRHLRRDRGNEERLLNELQETKSKERIYKFGLERFPSSIEFWKYVEPSASNVTYYSYVRDNSDSI